VDRRVDFLGASESEQIDRIKNLSGRSAADKMSKAEAEYQDSPKDIHMWATCTLFEPPRACKVIEGGREPLRLVQGLRPRRLMPAHAPRSSPPAQAGGRVG
jgi:hypothetical protein